MHIHITDKDTYQIFTSAHAGDIHYLIVNNILHIAVTTITVDTEQSWLATIRPKNLQNIVRTPSNLCTPARVKPRYCKLYTSRHFCSQLASY